MPDDENGDDVERHDGSGQVPAVPPMPSASQMAESPAESQPTRTPAQEISSAPNESEVKDLGDKIRAAEKWMIRLTAAIVFLTFGLVIVGFLQWNAMRGQLKEMEATLVFSQRPWVGIDKPTLAYDQATKHWSIDFVVKNYGSSPALHSVVGTTIPEYLTPAAQATMDHFGGTCGTADWLSTGKGSVPGMPIIQQIGGYTVFPGNSVISVTPQSIGETGKPARWMGCIAYSDQFGKLRHTRFCYTIPVMLTVGDQLKSCFSGTTAE